jgi:hypothetical protein
VLSQSSDHCEIKSKERHEGTKNTKEQEIMGKTKSSINLFMIGRANLSTLPDLHGA